MKNKLFKISISLMKLLLKKCSMMNHLNKNENLIDKKSDHT